MTEAGTAPDTQRQQTLKSHLLKVDVCCNLCGASDTTLITTGREHEYDNTTDDVFNVVACKNCGLCYLNPRPDVSELGQIYPPNYYSYGQQKHRLEANANSILQRLRYQGFRAKIARSLSLCPGHANVPVQVLDIGCGDGHTLDLYREVQDRTIETHGVDFNPGAIAMAEANGHKTYLGRFEDIAWPDCSFDLVYASHVIEHVPDPKAFTFKIRRILKPGGIFWFETPNIGSIDATWFRKKHWGAYHFPRHWFYFSRQTIEQLAKQCDFEIAHIDFVPNAIFWFWTFHSMMVDANPRLRPLADALLPPIDFQKDSFANFLRICFFCSIDVAIKKLTGETANMIVAFRKPFA
jgi:ubiquinone/menaquinone biosynthesis C-methylase UbiE